MIISTDQARKKISNSISDENEYNKNQFGVSNGELVNIGETFSIDLLTIEKYFCSLFILYNL